MTTKLHYKITMFDRDKNQTFEHKFYLIVKPDSTYIDILEQMIKELKPYNLEFSIDNLSLILAGNINPQEAYVVLEKVINE
jgi:hypothetical protein